jgi:hypothetical protein
MTTLPSYEEALCDAAKARLLFDASKGGNVRGITEDNRFELAKVFQYATAEQRETYKSDVMATVQRSGLRWVAYNREQAEIANMCFALKRPIANCASLILRLYTPEPRTAAGSLD